MRIAADVVKAAYSADGLHHGSFFWQNMWRTCGWWLVANTPTTGSPSVFCSQKKEPWLAPVL
jgi:hypothetical protein